MSSAKAASLTSSLVSGKGGSAAPSDPGAPLLCERSQDHEHMLLPLRLDLAQHRRLRLAAAHLVQTEEALVRAAIDHYLDRVVSLLLDGPSSRPDDQRPPRRGSFAAASGSAKPDRPQ